MSYNETYFVLWGLRPFWSSDLKQANEYSIKHPSDFWVKIFRKVSGNPNEWPWIKGHWSAWHLVPIKNCGLIRLNISCKYYDFGLHSYWKKNISRLFPYQCIRNQIWPGHKVGQGQPRFIICANLVGPTSPMLYTKSAGHWPFGSREEDFWLVLLLYVPSQQLWSLRDGQFTYPHFFLGRLEQAVNQ